MSVVDDAKQVMPFLRAVAEGKTVQYQRREAESPQWMPLSTVEDVVGAIVNGFTVRVAPPRQFQACSRFEIRQLLGETLTSQTGTPYRCVGVRLSAQDIVLAALREVGSINLKEYTAQELLEGFVLPDGSPCGVLCHEER